MLPLVDKFFKNLFQHLRFLCISGICYFVTEVQKYEHSKKQFRPVIRYAG